MIIVTEYIGKGPYGETALKLIGSIYKYEYISTIITGNLDENYLCLENLKIINLDNRNYFNWKWNNKISRFIIQLGFLNLYAKLKSRPYVKAFRQLSLINENCLIICGANSEYLLRLSNYCLKSWIHTVDPIPRDPSWEPNSFVRKQMFKVFCPYIKSAKILSTGNQVMSNYMQNNFMGTTFFDLMDGLPEVKNPKLKTSTKLDQVKILYLGALYNQRNPKELLTVIESLNKENSPRIILDIYGFSSFEINSEFVSIYSPINKISELIEEYDILLDINSNLQTDLYISHKLRTYIQFDKPILSICAPNSAVDQFLARYDFQIQVVRNNFISIKEGVENIIKDKDRKLTEREKSRLRYEADYQNQIKRLLELLSEI